jgi:cytidylate kinase
VTWNKDSRSACIFWLTGVAGTGKSTIARMIARTWADQKLLGPSFFFPKAGVMWVKQQNLSLPSLPS